MKKIIAISIRSKVIYDDEEKIYIKYFYPEKIKKIKFFLKLRKYPGENCIYISKFLNNNNIKTAKILEHTKYSIKTKEVQGKNLVEELLEANFLKKEELINKYINLVVKMIELGIYFGDLHFGNFILYNDELYVIDFEDYRKDLFSKFRKKSLLKRLRRYLLRINEIYDKEVYDGKKIYNKILLKLNSD